MPLGNLQNEGDLQRFIDAQTKPVAAPPSRGKVTVTFPGASQLSNVVTVPHGLVKVPSAIVVSARSSASTGGAPQFASVLDASVSASSFQTQAANLGTPGAGSTTTVDWVAYP